jgi:hypothetical protein
MPEPPMIPKTALAMLFLRLVGRANQHADEPLTTIFMRPQYRAF